MATKQVTKLEQAVILCGGRGTRLRPYTNENPKPMILCNGKPFIWYLLQQLHEQGISKFLLLTGYLGEKIENYFGDGSSFGWQIKYSLGPVNWDTGQRLWEAREKIDDCFILLYSDNFTPFPLDKVLAAHYKTNLALTFMASQKSPGNISIDDAGIVQKYNNNRLDNECNYVEIGYMIIEKEQAFRYFESSDCSFSTVIKSMVCNQQIGAWIQQDLYYSISDSKRWKKAEQYLESKKIIFLDRDGIINNKAPKGEYITNWKEFKFISDTYDVLKTLAKKGFKFIVITNQAGIARNKINYTDLDKIHRNLIDEYQKNGIEILKIYVCSHHWNEDCDCRKPKPGMFYEASKDFQIRLDKTLFLGDDIRDCKAAYNAGLQSIFIGDASELLSLSDRMQPIFASRKLSNILPNILEYFSLN